MVQVKQEFQQAYGKSLESFIEVRTARVWSRSLRCVRQKLGVVEIRPVREQGDTSSDYTDCFVWFQGDTFVDYRLLCVVAERHVW